MLRFGILSLIRTSSIQSSRFYRRVKTQGGDRAGFRRQMSELGDADLFMEDPEGSYEADMTQVKETWYEHKNEEERKKQKIKQKIIERKYFRADKQPSFLTWAEKEQIRHLNQQDPDDWNAQRLSESFPATVETILKIIKAKWTPNSMKNVEKHDESIKKNWQAFKANKLPDLDPELAEHLAKFSHRKFNSSKNAYVLAKNDQLQFKFPKPKRQEFSHIVSSCKVLQKTEKIADNTENKSEQIEAGEKVNSVWTNETSLKIPEVEMPKKLRYQRMRIDELQKKLKFDEEKADEDDFHVGFPKEVNLKKSLNEENKMDRAFEDFEEIDLNHSLYSKELSDIKSVDDENVAKIVNISPKQKVTKYAETNLKSSSMLNNLEPYVDKIVIPPEVRKKGGVYKVDDCFYDDTGEFLFRVPGLSTAWH